MNQVEKYIQAEIGKFQYTYSVLNYFKKLKIICLILATMEKIPGRQICLEYLVPFIDNQIKLNEFKNYKDFENLLLVS